MMITVTLPDGSSRQVAAGAPGGGRRRRHLTAPGQGRAGGGGRRPARRSHAIRSPATRASASSPTRVPKRCALARHSTAHLMAAAVTALFPGAQCGIGPAIDEGYFYDFVVPQPFVPEDLETHRSEDARAGGAGPGLRAPAVGPRRKRSISSPSAASRSRCSSSKRRPPARPRSRSTRSRTATPSSTSASARTCRSRPAQGVQADCDLERLLEGRREEPADAAALRHGVPVAEGARRAPGAIEEAKKRDHRKLGKELGLFTFHHWAPGATFWLAKGATLYNTLADYMRGVLFPPATSK